MENELGKGIMEYIRHGHITPTKLTKETLEKWVKKINSITIKRTLLINKDLIEYIYEHHGKQGIIDLLSNYECMAGEECLKYVNEILK